MRIIKNLILLTQLLLAINISGALGPFSSLLRINTNLDDKNNFNALLERQLSILQEEKTKLEENQSQIKAKLDSTNAEINSVKEKIKHASGVLKEFLSQKLLINNQSYQTLTEIEQIGSQIVLIIDSHSKILQEYKQDPEFKTKNLKLPNKSLYLFNDMQKINDLMGNYENELKDLEEKSKKITTDLSNRQKSQAMARQEYAEKKKQQEEFSAKTAIELSNIRDSFTTAQRADLLDDEEKLYRYKKELADMRVKEVEHKRNFLVDAQIKITRLQLLILKDEYERIKHLFKVDEKYLRNSELELEQIRAESTSREKKFKDTIEGLDIAKVSLEEELNKYKSQFNLSNSDIQAINDWTFSTNSLSSWGILLRIHKVLNKILLISINRNQLESDIEKERVKSHQAEITTRIIKTWYNLTNKTTGLDTVSDISKEIKYYEALKAEIQAADTSIVERKTGINNHLNQNSKILDNVKNHLKELKSQKDTIFQSNLTEYTHYFSLIKDAEEEIRSRSEPLTRIIEIYNQIHDIHINTLQKIDSILTELNSYVQGKSSTGILIKGLRDFIPDVYTFFGDFVNLIKSANFSLESFNVSNLLDYYNRHFYELFSIILQIFIIFLIFLLIKLYLPDFITYLSSLGVQYGPGYILNNFIKILLNFINNNLFGLFIWLILFLSFKYYITQPLSRIIFYFLSIPYLIFFARRFMKDLFDFNQAQNYRLINKIYEQRFFKVVNFLLFSTIFILLFRQAYLVMNYNKSKFPTLLLAINFIILQISLLLLISRDKILSIIPRNSSFYELLYNYINKYYYFFLGCSIFIILMSNPYLGYGPYFFNIISRIILILALIPLFSMIHNYVKKAAYFVFFQQNGEMGKERFSSAKTAYGLFVIVSFMSFVFLAIILGANIWGYKVDFALIVELLHKELQPLGLDSSGRTIYLMPVTFLKIFGFVLFGFFIAYIFNRFLLKRVFDLLLVNIGVQNALITLIRYSIIISTIIIGFVSVGLGSSLLYIFAIIGGLGVAAKELITDLIAYFIILVQRPIKIGDLIMINDETRGVVRHITLRSVVLRIKNSVTVFVPNSQIISKNVMNWNYSRTFFAFDDILLTVPYSTDPSEVKDLILKVLDINTNVLKNPPPTIQLRDFTDNGYQFLIRGFMSSDKVLDQNDIASDIRIELVKKLKSLGIEVGSPTRTVRIISREEIS